MAEALVATQLISFAFQSFQGCIEAYGFFYTALNIGKDGDILRTMLMIERDRLEEWAKQSGLTSEQPNGRLNWGLIEQILQQQATLLMSEEKLKQTYHLDLQMDDHRKEFEVRATGLERFVTVLRPELYTGSSRVIAAANGPWKRLKWSATGRLKVVKVVEDLRNFNDHLESVLDRAIQAELRQGHQLLLRDLLIRSTSLPEVDNIIQLLRPNSSKDEAAIAAAAEFKRIRLYLGADQRADEIRPQLSTQLKVDMPPYNPLKMKRLNAATSTFQHGFEVAVYETTEVLVEWRRTDEFKFEVLEKSMQRLSVLLSKAHTSFAALPCKGLLTSRKDFRFGLVYNMPPSSDAELSPPGLESRTLYSLIAEQPQASLRERCRVATILAEAILQLHTAGWLHKSIRSENVVFLARSGNGEDGFLHGMPYLVGYDLARPDTKDAAVALTDLPDTSLHLELYRHPDKRDAVGKSFRKLHDLYALANVLVELALWDRLDSIYSRFSDKDWKAAIQGAEANKQTLQLPSLTEIVSTSNFRQTVAHSVGVIYLEAIDACLSEPPKVMEDEAVSLAAHRAIVDSLRLCRV